MFAAGIAFFGAVIAAAAVITSADTYFASVALLMHLDSDFPDVKGHVVAVTGAVISLTQKLFNQNTAHFIDSSDYLSLPASADFYTVRGISRLKCSRSMKPMLPTCARCTAPD